MLTNLTTEDSGVLLMLLITEWTSSGQLSDDWLASVEIQKSRLNAECLTSLML